MFADLQTPVFNSFKYSGLDKAIGAENIFSTVHEAVEAALALEAKEVEVRMSTWTIDPYRNEQRKKKKKLKKKLKNRMLMERASFNSMKSLQLKVLHLDL